MPQSIEIDKAFLSTTPTILPFLDLKQFELSLNSVFIDIYKIIDNEPNTVQVSEFSLVANSNLSTLKEKGKIINDHLTSTGSLRLSNTLFKQLDIPLKDEALKEIPFSIDADIAQLTLKADIEADKLLDLQDLKFDIDHLNLKNTLHYTFSDALLDLYTEGNLSTTFSKHMHINNHLQIQKEKLHYEGSVLPGSLTGIDSNQTELLNNLKLIYKGTKKQVDVEIDSDKLQGSFSSLDMKKGELFLKTKTALKLTKILPLPKALQDANASIALKVPIDFKYLSELNASAKVLSDIVNIDANLSYDKQLQIWAITTLPKTSLLHTISHMLDLNALSPLQSNIKLNKHNIDIKLHTRDISIDSIFNSDTGYLKGSMNLGKTKFHGEGQLNRKFTLQSSVNSIQTLFSEVQKVIPMTLPLLDGDAKISLTLKDFKQIDTTLYSKNLMYNKEGKKKTILSDTSLSLGYRNKHLLVNNYRTTFMQEKFFATKPSKVFFEDNIIHISPLWVNDELKVTGQYNFNKREGTVFAYADKLNIDHEKASLSSHVNIKSQLSGNHSTTTGTLNILGGTIHYDMDTRTFSSDNDIIIKEAQKKSNMLPQLKNQAVDVNIRTQSLLIYKNNNANLKAAVDIHLKKTYQGDLKNFGNIQVMGGSTYTFKGHRFVLKKSNLIFTGEAKKPVLDIAAVYKTHSTEITVQITGNPSSPHYIFSSTPYMGRQEILSILLFDRQKGVKVHNEEAVEHSVGSSMVHSVFGNVGNTVNNTIFSKFGMKINNIPFIGDSVYAKRRKNALTSLFYEENGIRIPEHPIHFYGQKVFDEHNLQKAMGIDTGNPYLFWTKKEPKIQDRLLPTLENSLRNFYESKGYYNATFKILRSKTDIHVQIQENRPVKIKTINIQSDLDLKGIPTFKKDTVFTSKEFVSVKQDIINTLMHKGYCNYDLDSKAYVDKAMKTVDISIVLKKGPVCHFGKITVKGLDNIDDGIVLSRVRAKEGERFSSEKIQKSYYSLYGLDAFDSIFIDDKKEGGNVVPLTITGKEIKNPWYVKGGIGWEGDTGFRLSSEVVRTNLGGNAKQLGFELVYSDNDKLAEIEYFAPAIFKFSKYYIDMTLKTGYNRFKYSDFIEDKVYTRGYLGYEGEHTTLNAGVAIEGIRITPIEISNEINPINEANHQLFYPFLELTYDNRDSKLNPKNGYYLSGSVEYAIPYDTKASSYLKYQVEGRAILTLMDKLTLSTVGRFGTFTKLIHDIPVSKLFYEGGINSNRAYGYKRIGLVLSPTTFAQVGGTTITNLTFEANYPLWGNIYGAIFNDNTLLSLETFGFDGDILSSAGLGLRYVTPIGPIKLDFGMNVEETSQHTLHFQIGHSF